MRYVVIVEQGPTGVGAYAPDLPGCGVIGETRQEALALLREAIELHIESLREHGEPVPNPSSSIEFIDVAA